MSEPLKMHVRLRYKVPGKCTACGKLQIFAVSTRNTGSVELLPRECVPLDHILECEHCGETAVRVIDVKL